MARAHDAPPSFERRLDEVRKALDRLPRPGTTPRPAPVVRAPPTAPRLATRTRSPSEVERPPTTQPVAPAIQAVGLTKKYRGTAAVAGLSFSIPRGQVTAFVGPNGSGKTTTIRMLLGLVRRDSGDATILGAPMDKPQSYLGRVGALVEAPAFEPQLSGRRNLQVLADLSGTPTAGIPTVLQLVGLAGAGKKPYKAYSLGMRQRLGIAACLLGDPDLLILDEPTNGLDISGIHEMRHLLRQLAEQGKTIFVSSHLISEVEQFCDHLVIIREGRLVHQGPVAGLTAGGSRLEDAVLALTGRGSL